MKVWKKTLALVMALGMTVGFAACGGSDSGNGGGGGSIGEIKGEQLAEGGWALAWSNTFAATNMKLKGEIDSYETITEEGEQGWNKETGECTIQLADGKLYVESEVRYQWESEDEGDGDETEEMEIYVASIDGNPYQWMCYGGDWMQVEYYQPFAGTGADLIAFLSNGEDLSDYEAWEAYAEYQDGVYVLQRQEMTYKFAFENNYLVGVEMIENDTSNSGYTCESTTKYVISYGGASVGELPEVEAE